jgi:hypothetical protein
LREISVFLTLYLGAKQVKEVVIMSLFDSQYVPEDYEIIPYRFVECLRYHRGESAEDTRARLDKASAILRDRAKHLTSLSREQGQYAVRDYARVLTKVARLLQGPMMGLAVIVPGQVDLSFNVDPQRTIYRIYVAHRRTHRKHKVDS